MYARINTGANFSHFAELSMLLTSDLTVMRWLLSRRGVTGAGTRRCPHYPRVALILPEDLIARQPPVGDPMWTSGFETEPIHLVLLVGSKIAFEPEPLCFVSRVAFPRQDVRAGAVQEPAVVGNDHRAARELLQRVFQRA